MEYHISGDELFWNMNFTSKITIKGDSPNDILFFFLYKLFDFRLKVSVKIEITSPCEGIHFFLCLLIIIISCKMTMSF